MCVASLFICPFVNKQSIKTYFIQALSGDRLPPESTWWLALSGWSMHFTWAVSSSVQSYEQDCPIAERSGPATIHPFGTHLLGLCSYTMRPGWVCKAYLSKHQLQLEVEYATFENWTITFVHHLLHLIKLWSKTNIKKPMLQIHLMLDYLRQLLVVPTSLKIWTKLWVTPSALKIKT